MSKLGAENLFLADLNSLVKLNSVKGEVTKRIQDIFGDVQINICVLSPCEKMLLVVPKDSNTFKVFDTNNLEVVYENSKLHEAAISSVTFSLRGFCVVASIDGTLSIHDIPNSEVLACLKIDEAISSIQLHPDGLILAVGLQNGRIRLYDIRNMEQ